jgi:hypothetical protein
VAAGEAIWLNVAGLMSPLASNRKRPRMAAAEKVTDGYYDALAATRLT